MLKLKIKNNQNAKYFAKPLIVFMQNIFFCISFNFGNIYDQCIFS